MLKNLFSDLPSRLPDELFSTLLEAANVRVERIVSRGHVSPKDFWYCQDQHEWIVVLKGSARLRFEDTSIEMNPGDFMNIAAHTKHRVEWTYARRTDHLACGVLRKLVVSEHRDRFHLTAWQKRPAVRTT